MDNGIYWIVSYPKSGNTWCRMILNNYIANLNEPLNINHLNTKFISSNRKFFDEIIGLSSSDMSEDEIKLYQPEVYKELIKNTNEDLFIKVHDAYIFNKDNKPIFPEEITKGVIYIVRNPLDVVVSYANHMDETIENTIKILNNKTHTLDIQFDELNIRLPQFLGDWSFNVNSWLDSKLPIHLIKYEDMLDNTFSTFYKTLEFLGFDIDTKRLQKAIDFSSFKELQKQEKIHGFIEKSPKTKKFFNSGKKDIFKEHLTEKQIKYIVYNNFHLMKKLNYIH